MYLSTTYEPQPRPKPEMKFADRKGGFPHSEISGSKGARASPELIAACHVLHRLSTPRHPSEALMRLIVLSKTHAWGRFARPRYETRTRAHTCALSLPDNDVFHQVSPPRPCGPGKPFHSRCQNLNPPTAGDAPGLGRTRKLFSCDRALTGLEPALPGGEAMVEPDGIEPTTSCLQSTRSTN